MSILYLNILKIHDHPQSQREPVVDRRGRRRLGGRRACGRRAAGARRPQRRRYAGFAGGARPLRRGVGAYSGAQGRRRGHYRGRRRFQRCAVRGAGRGADAGRSRPFRHARLGDLRDPDGCAKLDPDACRTRFARLPRTVIVTGFFDKPKAKPDAVRVMTKRENEEKPTETPTKTSTYVYCRQLRTGRRLLFRDDAVLGLLGQHPENGRQNLALRTLLLGLCDRHVPLRADPFADDGQLRFRRPAVPARSGTGLRSQYHERTVGRRDLQRIEYPALRLDRAGRHGRRIPAGRGPRAGSRRDHQLCGCAERRSCDSVRRRGADRGGDRLQRHRFGTNAEGCGRQLEQPQGHRAGDGGRRADVVFLPVRRRGDGSRPF